MPKKSNSQKQHQQQKEQQSQDKMASPPSPKPTNVDPAAPSSYANVAHLENPPASNTAAHDVPPSPPQSTIEDEKVQQGYELVGRAIDAYPPGKSYATGIDEAPVTLERTPYIPGDNEPLLDPGTARATIAASREAPNGTVDAGWTRKHQDKTVLQQHLQYFDPDQDNIIWPRDTYTGCRKWGWSIPLSLIVALIIHGALSYPTVPHLLLPDPLFRIYVERAHKQKHGSSSDTYDNEGRFRPQQFEDMFAKYDDGNKGGLDAWDLVRFWRGQVLVFDFFGATASALEWFATYLLLWPEDGVLRKEDVRRVYDGSIFQHKADEYARKKQKQRGGGGAVANAKNRRLQAGAWWSQSAKTA
ncbi:caleosin domain-containing protein [Diplodia corticola]|uniref:Caleosin domain-containing protein n=1 Tax=Diplodia corticola TaxID=236234 RepID=A0A1J9RVZ3_9PEZI|nr:caleosin domain-containing protein [Diplodia corticola]OJD36787.1 caleosin domain-containing protein [Diplodia corticola]